MDAVPIKTTPQPSLIGFTSAIGYRISVSERCLEGDRWCLGCKAGVASLINSDDISIGELQSRTVTHRFRGRYMSDGSVDPMPFLGKWGPT